MFLVLQIFPQYNVDAAGYGGIVDLRQFMHLFQDRLIQRNTDFCFQWFHFYHLSIIYHQVELNIAFSYQIAYNPTKEMIWNGKGKKTPPSYDEEVFEANFSEFWESQECDDLNWVLYDLIKAAYAAGYRTAGKEPPEYRRKVRTSFTVVEREKG